MANPNDYAIVSQIHVNQWVPELQQVVPGWQYQVRDSVTGTIVPVFIADTDYDVNTVQTAIEAALVPVRQIAQLGKKPAQPAA